MGHLAKKPPRSSAFALELLVVRIGRKEIYILASIGYAFATSRSANVFQFHTADSVAACVGTGAVFFTTVFFAFATVFFVAAAFFVAFAGAGFTAAFFPVVFFRAGAAVLAAALAFAAFAALALFRFATRFAFAAAESFRFGFAGPGVAASAWTLDAAHLLRCASAMAFLPAALILRLGLAAPVGVVDGADARPPNWLRIAAIVASVFCLSAS